MEAVHVQLPDERGNVSMLEVLAIAVSLIAVTLLDGHLREDF